MADSLDGSDQEEADNISVSEDDVTLSESDTEAEDDPAADDPTADNPAADETIDNSGTQQFSRPASYV
jgi:hypothetical protein